jgi:hypothetical protein
MEAVEEELGRDHLHLLYIYIYIYMYIYTHAHTLVGLGFELRPLNLQSRCSMA